MSGTLTYAMNISAIESNNTGITSDENENKPDDLVQSMSNVPVAETNMLESALYESENKFEGARDKEHFIRNIANQIQETGSKSSPPITP